MLTEGRVIERTEIDTSGRISFYADPARWLLVPRWLRWAALIMGLLLVAGRLYWPISRGESIDWMGTVPIMLVVLSSEMAHRDRAKRLRQPVIVVDPVAISGRTRWGRRVVLPFAQIEAISWETESLGLLCGGLQVALPYAPLAEVDRRRVGELIRERMSGEAPEPEALRRANLQRKTVVVRRQIMQAGAVMTLMIVGFLGTWFVSGLFQAPTTRAESGLRFAPPPRPPEFDLRGTPVEAKPWRDSEYVGVWRRGRRPDWIRVDDDGRAERCLLSPLEEKDPSRFQIEKATGVLLTGGTLVWDDLWNADHLWTAEREVLCLGQPGRRARYEKTLNMPWICARTELGRHEAILQPSRS